MIKCEKCGEPIDKVYINFFERDGSDCEYPCSLVEYGDAIITEVSPDWTGAELSEHERLETISCPHCGKYPFNSDCLNTQATIRLVMFRGCVEPESEVFDPEVWFDPYEYLKSDDVGEQN